MAGQPKEQTEKSTYAQVMDYVSYAIKGEAILSIRHQQSCGFETSGVYPYDLFHDDTRRRLEIDYAKVEQNLSVPSKRFKHFGCVAYSQPPTP